MEGKLADHLTILGTTQLKFSTQLIKIYKKIVQGLLSKESTNGSTYLYNFLARRTLAILGRINVRLVSSSARLDLTIQETMLLFVCCAAVESKLGKLEISRTVILIPKVSVLCLVLFV